MTLGSMFGKYDRKLRKYCKEQIRQGVSDPSAQWICDNYHTCSAALKAAKSYLSQKGEKGLLPLFLSCKELADTSGEITDNRIIKRFSGEKLTVFKSEALQFLLFAAYAVSAYEKASEGEDASEAVKNLIKLRDINFSALLSFISPAEKYLLDDPSGVYEKCDEKTKQLYRKAVKNGAKKENKDEISFIKEKLNKARNAEDGKTHIGFYLDIIPDRKKGGRIFIIAEWLVALFSAVLFSFFVTGSLFPVLLLLFPFYAIIKPLSDILSAKIFPPFILPSLNEDEIISADTLIAVSCVMPPASDAEKLFSHLSRIYSSNSCKNVKIMLLTDLKNSSSPEDASDKSDIAAVKRLIDRLNEKHNGGFCLAVRDRVYSPTENRYTGFERKRGAIMALTKYLRDKNSGGFSVLHGDTEGIQNMEYILALDSDTSLSFESVAKLIAAARHPLNKPVTDSMVKRVVSGYGIINPVTETSIESSEKTVFSGIFTSGGAVAYSSDVNERYADMFSESIFTGKGLINIDAFLETAADKFENDRILSHDILEGAVMRTAFFSGTRFTDSFPSSAKGYFLRLHRWIRGDVQNLRYIFRPLGTKGDSPEMPMLGKYQLFDNFRRAFTPVISLVLLLLSCFCEYFNDTYLYLSAGFLSAIAPEAVSVIYSLLKNGPSVFRAVYFSADITAVNKSIIRLGVNCASLPEYAFICADAIIRALYRSFVSKKKLLQWTAAADAENIMNTNTVYTVLLPLTVSVIFFVFGTSLHRLIALAVILFIPFSLSKGIKNVKRKELPPGENESRILNSFAASAWRFFEENLSAFENWLPPDNVQETPVPRKAKRTSPTNIGLYFTSCLAAADLFFITSDELYKRIDDTLTTIERMPKYKGLLYNWYDTVRLTPLKPAYVSAVDCGNYLVCLTAVKEGLKEYASRDKKFFELINRIQAVLDESDLTVLYDKNRDLFRIGLDCETGKVSDAHYDLYMSEARMTSYYECAKRHIPARHWASLGRTLKRSGAYVTASSWTGTLFEYFMPCLFMPVFPGSFQYEALKVCLFIQKKFAEKAGIPYGISESCFYALDAGLNYKYKAHGLKSLALKREADEEKVVSPYSVFLTLPFDRKSAMKALGKLSALHIEGRCGFYEAVDFTRERTDGEEYAVVRSYMSHHVGMSLVALCNALKGNIFVERFMADEDMDSAKILLEEKLPVHPPVFSGVKSIEKQSKKDKGIVSRNVSAKGSSVYSYSNGEVTLFCDKYGDNRCVFAGNEIYKYSSVSKGISVGFAEDDSVITPLFPLCGDEARLKSCGMTSNGQKDGLNVTSALMVHPSENALLVPVKAENESDETRSVNVYFYFEPRLDKTENEDRHPAFSDMFIKAYKDKKANAAVFYKAGDDNTAAVAAGLWGKEPFVCCLDREKAVSRKKDAESVFFRDYNGNAESTRGVNPVCAVSTALVLKPGESRECVLVLAFGGETENALHCLYSVRKSSLPALSKGAAATFLRDGTIFNFACNFISSVFFNGERSPLINEAVASFSSDISSLWKCGISGDLPIFTVFPEADCPEGFLRAFVRFHKRLAKCSVLTDAVFIFEGNKDYGYTQLRRLMNVIKEEGRQDIQGQKGGIHILYRGELDRDSFEAIIAFSAAVYPDNGFVSMPEKPFVPRLCPVRPENDGENVFSDGGYIINRHSAVPWSHTLSNKTFGTLVTDRSPGFTWALNSGLNKLTPWSNNTAEDLTGERLFLKKDGNVYDVTDNATVIFADSFAQYNCFADDIFVSVKIFVPEKGMKKHIKVSVENKGGKKCELKLFFCVFPVMGEKNSQSRFVKIKKGINTVSMINPLNDDYKGVFRIGAFGENTLCCDSLKEFFGEEKRCAGILQKFALDSNEKKSVLFFALFSHNGRAAEKLMLVPAREKTSERYRFFTPYKELNEFSSALLYHQVKDTRINARCGFYQCSGALGYRDQLQDALALINRDNALVKQLIFKAASAQFYEGDVLHWFHVIYKKGLIYKGVRTLCSDDMLWLVYTVSQYILKTGDIKILDIKIPFTEGEALKEGQTEHYGEYRLSDKSASLFVHCIASLNRAFTKGMHSLPLMGNGDWNDSFSHVGRMGVGESVWLGMFIRRTSLDFAKICEMVNRKELSDYLIRTAEEYTEAIDKYAWNGKWYLRGFYDDGEPLGDMGAESCETDILTAAWSVLSDMPDKQRRKQALISAYERLFDEKNGVVKLFSPPFNENGKYAGYVNRYPEGMRENGGQYTHAAVWFCMALFKEGLKEEAEKVLYALLPNVKYQNGKGDIYKTEPYALSGDVYNAKGHEGRGGWSLYTGSAGWLLQLAEQLNKS